jgi:hypothetical protein
MRKSAEGPSTFIQQLYLVAHEQPNEEILCWSHDGKRVIVLDGDRFDSELLPKYFNKVKPQSFRRQLDYYRFKRLPDCGSNGWSMSHPNFIYNRYDLISTIKRVATPKAMISSRIEERISVLEEKLIELQDEIQELNDTMGFKRQEVMDETEEMFPD